MMCLFGLGKVAETNEEYKAVLKRRMVYMGLVVVLGIITLCFEAAARFGSMVMLSEYMHGVYTGIGTGFIVAGALSMLRDYKILHNEEKLKKERLKNTDERNRMIYGKALQYAGTITLVCAYIVMLVAGIYSEVVFACFYIFVMSFMILYVIIAAVLNKKL